MNLQAKEIYFHIGLGKAASTFLQYQFFPNLEGIKYLQRGKYSKYKKHISNCIETKILISREMDNQLFDEVGKFFENYPHAKIIVVFRRHSAWLLSQYKRQVKNGFDKSFEAFIDVKSNNGYWKTEQAVFKKMIQFINEKSINDPLILDYALIKNSPKTFYDQIANYTNTNYNFDTLNKKTKHKSYNRKQLLLKRKLNKFLFNKNWEFSHSNFLNWIFRRIEMLLTYAVFLIASFIPDSFYNDQKLYDENYLNDIDSFYQNDWEYVCKFFD